MNSGENGQESWGAGPEQPQNGTGNTPGKGPFTQRQEAQKGTAKKPERKKRYGFSQARLFPNTRVLCTAAMLCVLSFILGYIAKQLQGTNPLRITFENLPVVLSGICFGPLVGAAVGIAADVLSCIVAAQPLNPLITVGAAAIGLLAGLLGRRIPLREVRLFPVLLCEFCAQAVGSMAIKTFALSFYFGIPAETLLWRVPIYLAVSTAEGYLIFELLRNRAIGRELERMMRK